MKHLMNLCEKPFEAIVDGYKTIEMRTNKDSRKAIKIGDSIEFTNNKTNEKIECLVVNKFEYNDFAELYKNHSKTSIGYKDEEIACPDDMLIYYTREEIQKYGVVGIEIKMLGEVK